MAADSATHCPAARLEHTSHQGLPSGLRWRPLSPWRRRAHGAAVAVATAAAWGQRGETHVVRGRRQVVVVPITSVWPAAARPSSPRDTCARGPASSSLVQPGPTWPTFRRLPRVPGLLSRQKARRLLAALRGPDWTGAAPRGAYLQGLLVRPEMGSEGGAGGGCLGPW